MKKLIIATAIGIMTLSGATWSNSAKADNQLLGTLLGAAGGGFIGSNIGRGNGRLAATAFGTLFGAYVGNQVSRTNHNRYPQATTTRYPQPTTTTTTTTTVNRNVFYQPPVQRRPHHRARHLTWPAYQAPAYGTTTTVRTVRRGIDPWGNQCRYVYRSVQTPYGSRQVQVRECN